eukprot:CAMPEP_0185304770 /NCGR_PEP_ID=MMETSP1363-20130426/14972_1 /TAXON_ID=38817 /ORGANISM="Gephyrocapsa oceanica, Strain RCC1303" /LENGTH=69 /DNA_ID=CAMNT_0027901975 /DNA_START=6 /DNA_END=215 /DNA_ORIENTATION=-
MSKRATLQQPSAPLLLGGGSQGGLRRDPRGDWRQGLPAVRVVGADPRSRVGGIPTGAGGGEGTVTSGLF